MRNGGTVHIKKAAIIGKGAVGLLYGSLIARNIGPDAVEYVMDDDRLARHAEDALTINGRPCRIRTVGASIAAEEEPVDLLILAIKATGLEQALVTMESCVGPQTRIISLLNGITSEEAIAQRFGWENTVLSVAQGMDAVFIDNALTYTHPGEIRLGPAPATAPGVVDQIADFLARAGISHAVEANIRRRQWVKFMLNVGLNQTCMVFGGSYGSIAAPGEQNRCFIAAMREAIAVAHAEGVDLDEDDLLQMVSMVESLDPAGMPSMAQDRINRKRSEVDQFAGTVIRLADRHDILVPQNRYLYNRIAQIEAAYMDELDQ